MMVLRVDDEKFPVTPQLMPDGRGRQNREKKMSGCSQVFCLEVNFEDTCKGFLEVAKEAVHQTVSVIFEDPGLQELLVRLYHRDWLEGQVTEYLVATFGDYFTDVKIKTMSRKKLFERMRLDEEVIMDFFREYISVSLRRQVLLQSNYFYAVHKVENRVKVLGDLRELASSESPDSFTLVYTNILDHQPDCPPEVEKIVSLREGIPRKDAKEVVQECKDIYEHSLVDGNPPKTGFVFPRVKCLSASKVSLWRKLT
ncbi:hypothetical protein ACH5RR_034480 [Cinchona calisaya]|uniref:Exocyst complex component Sec6 n=1 Tax=Cinchona calisaya TaxID=153742 RepID=A0ABD2YEZ1_9GENT